MIYNTFNNTLSYCLIFYTILLSFQATAQIKELTESYNYTEIADHPRLLLSKNDEKELIKAIQNSKEFSKIDTFIHEVSKSILKETPVSFEKRGKRLLHVSRMALIRLYYLSYSYRTTKDIKYLKRAEVELNAICNFESWNPSHFLDVGEMCMGVSIAYDWLYYDLQEETKQKVRKAILEKAFAPSYISKNNWFLDRHSNWNSVCNAGLVYGALAIMEDEKEQSIAIIERALKSNVLPLEAYAPDGNYPEGPGYWNYGTTFQVMLFAALESALGSDLGLSNSPGFMESANYMLFSGGPSGEYFNYYDCGSQQTARSSMFWFAEKTQNTSLVFQELEMIKAGTYTQVVSSDIERILPNAIIFGKNLDLKNIKTPSEKIFTGHGITPVTMVRTDWDGRNGKYLGIKGGSASDGHSHMDQGTFVYDIGRQRWAMDFGMQSYITLESKGVDIWNLTQNAQRWDVFRYNNLNHNTLSINNLLHNVKGKAKIIETFDSRKELGAKVDLTEVLNFNNELSLATRKATIIKDEYLEIEDIIHVNSKKVDLRWNMVSPASAEIINESTIKLSQNGKILFLKVDSTVPFKLVIRPSENPKKYKNEFKNKKYGDYNMRNVGTVMVGFDAVLPPDSKAKFNVTLKEGKSDIQLKKNTIILDAPDPNTASEGNSLFSDISPIKINSSGDMYSQEKPDWISYGKITIKNALNKVFKFKVSAKKITSKGIINSGIDRSADGQLGVRGGDGGGIEKNEGFIFGLDLSDFDSTVTFQLTKIGFTFLDSSESCVIVNRKNPNKMLVYSGKDKGQSIKITENYSRNLVDISSLEINLTGGINYSDILSLFNTSEAGSFRVSSFELKVK